MLPSALQGLLSEIADRKDWSLPAGLPAGFEERMHLGRAVVEYHVRKPSLVTFEGLVPAESQSRCANRAIEELYEGAVRHARIDETVIPADGALICFGAGHHVPMMLSAFPTRDLIVVDPHVGAVCQMLSDFDWEEVVETVLERRGACRFVCHDDPVVAAIAAIAAVRGGNIGLVDGSRIVAGYSHPAIAAVAGAFQERRAHLVAYDGFVEDEDTLLDFAARNSVDTKVRTLGARSSERVSCPAVIVGSGSSLDASLDWLDQVRDRLVVISCGSALMALLARGIVPDLHCELEAHPSIDEILRFTAQDHDLSEIRLIASNTVFPEILSHFKSALLCNREGTLPTRVFDADAWALPLIAPSCTNTACSFALALGFREIVLCGTDLGSREEHRHHADSTIYHRLEDYKDFVGEDRKWVEEATSTAMAFGQAVPGNFGGDVLTNTLMLQMRTSFELFAATVGDVRLVNISDGAAIAGFEPVRPRDYAAHLKGRADIERPDLDALFGRVPGRDGANSLDPARLAEFRRLMRRWRAEAMDMLSDPACYGSAVGLYDRLKPFLQTDDTQSGAKDLWTACCYAYSGSVMKVVHFIRYAEARTEDADRLRLMTLAKEVLPQAVMQMTDLLERRIENIASGTGAKLQDVSTDNARL